jgi:hypothetical protein
MPFFIIVLVALLILIAGTGINKCFSQNGKDIITTKTITDSSRNEIAAMVANIERKTTPAKKMGAMCYEVAFAPEYLEYICCLDGEKTVYDRNVSNTYWMIEPVVEMRRLVDQINTSTELVKLILDEGRLCGKCSPNLEDQDRYVSLITLYSDGSQYIHDKITIDDLRKLSGFFSNRLYYETSNEGQLPLKEEIPKLKTILGIENN